MKIAVVGSGISGLVCAHLLDGAHEVTVYEAGEHVGGHTHTLSVDDHGTERPVDVGFIVFNDRTYPGFCALLDELGVESAPTEMSFSARDERTGVEYRGGGGPLGLFAQPRNALRPGFGRMLRDMARFSREVGAALDEGFDDPSETIASFCGRRGYSREFLDWHLVPAAAAVWSAEPDQLREEVPLLFLATFFRNHGLLGLRGRPTWRYVRGGSRTYVEAILARMRGRVRPAMPVDSVRRTHDGVEVVATGGESEAYDEVILACHADQALALVADPLPDESRLLAAFPYAPNDATLHVDDSLMPMSPRAWASWNAHVGLDSRRVSLTYWMNRLQRIDSTTPFLVTLNRDDIPDRHVIARTSTSHPTYTRAGVAAQAEHRSVIRREGISYCGAYWGWGFHEDGVQSALRVCEAFGSALPTAAHDLPAEGVAG